MSEDEKGITLSDLVHAGKTFWEIVQGVAEGEFLYSDDGVDVYYCPFPHCDGEISGTDHREGEELTHSPDCIITKARQLTEWRKAQPRIEVKSKPMVCALCGKHYVSTDSGWCGRHSMDFCSRDHMERWQRGEIKHALILGDEVTLWDLRPGAIFMTREGICAVKSKYIHPDNMCECVLLASGEYMHLEEGNKTLVREVRIGE